MAKMDLTDAYLRSLRVEVRTEITDAKETGLLLRAYPSGKKTFAFRFRGGDGRIQGTVIGHYPEIKLAAARLEAAELRKRVRKGDDVTKAAESVAGAIAAEIKAGIPTLEKVLQEYELEMSPKRKIWQRTKNGYASEAGRRIESVFGSHLHLQIDCITLRDIAHSMAAYAPKSGKASANGQVSRARSYLMPVFDWSAHRNRFSKIGLGRHIQLSVIDLRQTHDPASEDHDIKGYRDRALDHIELGSVLPLLVWPAPSNLKMKLKPEEDIRPVALKFLLLTCARLDELVKMRWRDFRENSGLWHKPYVKTISGPPRQQNLPLSDAAIHLLKGLPNFQRRQPDDLVFPNQVGNGIGNWGRITKAVQRESKTDAWHRHDLRRTGASIMKALGIAPRVIDEILAHNASNKDEGTSRALENYFVKSRILDHIEDPQKVALDELAKALDYIENDRGQQ